MADAPRVFLSYSHDSDEHADRVLALADALRDRGIDVTLDRYVHPAPAQGWPRWMEQNLDTARFVLMVCTETYRRRVMGLEEPGKGLGVDWEGNLIYNKIYSRIQDDQPGGSRFISILLPGSEPAHIPDPIRGHSYYRFATFDLTDPGFEALYRHLTGQPATPRPDLASIQILPPKTRRGSPPDPTGKAACPYPGMRPFREADSDRFFGREREVEKLLKRLRLRPLLAVIGPSGSGKSSLVFAGLIPALRRSGLFGTGGWAIRIIRPGERPMMALDEALGGDPADPARAVAKAIESEPGARRLLLVVDQFEELFTIAHTDAVAFQHALRRLAETPNAYVIVTARADFYPHLMVSPLWPEIRTRRVEVVPLDEGGLRQAIVRPAEAVGVFVEEALVERLVADAAGEPGVLPLVQETLVLLWDRLERQSLPLRAYEELTRSRGASEISGGELTGLQVALADRADEALNALDKPEKEQIARRIFLRLVQFGEGRADTRRQQTVDVLGVGSDPDLFKQTLDHLADRRLLTLGGDLSGDERTARRSVDLAHEALISGWPQLRLWLRERRGAEQMRRLLEEKASEWVRLGRSTGGLLDMVELAEVEQWLASPDAADLGSSETLRALIKASRDAVDKAEREREEIIWKLSDEARYQAMVLTKEELDNLRRRFAQHFAAVRGADPRRRSSQTEKRHDWHLAGVFLASDILLGGFNFAKRITHDSYSLLEKVWLDDVKQMNAYFKWYHRGGGVDPRLTDKDYFDACEEIRGLLVDEKMKAEPAAFREARAYLESNYLTAGKFDRNGYAAEELVQRKAKRVGEMRIARGIQEATKYEEDLHNLVNAEEYAEMFYNNIIPAIMEDDTESVLTVLKTFQFSKAPENSYWVINCFETALAIYFLRPSTIQDLWNKSDRMYPDLSVPESSVRSVVEVRSWPKGWPKGFVVPEQCKGRFEPYYDKIIFKGLMTESQKNALLERAGKESEDNRDYKQAIFTLFNKSRLIIKNSTL